MIRDLLFERDPYLGFTPLPERMNGWNSTSVVFRMLIEEIKPRLIVEVGSWLGASAIHMARQCDAEIVCVDTWLGSPEMWGRNSDCYRQLGIEHGRPTIYDQFLSNVIHSRLQSTITPFPQTSQNAACWFYGSPIKPDLVYIDGSHEYEAVKADIASWASVVRLGGVLFGDDMNACWPGVEAAVVDSGFPFERHGEKWVVRL